MHKKLRVRTLIESQHVKGTKDCLNLHGSILSYFFDQSERKLARKTLFY